MRQCSRIGTSKLKTGWRIIWLAKYGPDGCPWEMRREGSQRTGLNTWLQPTRIIREWKISAENWTPNRLQGKNRMAGWPQAVEFENMDDDDADEAIAQSSDNTEE
jgi:hypothetical protein